jgi:methylthioribose-1-phosphate isomerase
VSVDPLAPRSIIRLEQDAVVALDQTALPERVVERRCSDVDDVIAAIRELAVRGAPLLGIAGAMGVALAARAAIQRPEAEFRTVVEAQARRLASARPTAVNLAFGVDRALAALAGVGDPPSVAVERVADAAHALHDEEVDRCRAIGAHGAALLGSGARICTVCNAGALATGGYGTALGVVRALQDQGRRPHVWVPETRPLLQGARLTAWELGRDGIAHGVLPDGAAAGRFAAGEVDAVVVGADRIAANGDTANKVGTYALAVLARHHGVPFFVAAPSSTIDPATPTGAAIPIEQRDREEVARFGERTTVPDDSVVVNPAFDVTPAALIDAIITESGVIRPPFAFSA